MPKQIPSFQHIKQLYVNGDFTRLTSSEKQRVKKALDERLKKNIEITSHLVDNETNKSMIDSMIRERQEVRRLIDAINNS